MPSAVNASAARDPLVARFETNLMAERSLSENTRDGYLTDLAQLAAHAWGEGAKPPFDWALRIAAFANLPSSPASSNPLSSV